MRSALRFGHHQIDADVVLVEASVLARPTIDQPLEGQSTELRIRGSGQTRLVCDEHLAVQPAGEGWDVGHAPALRDEADEAVTDDESGLEQSCFDLSDGGEVPRVLGAAEIDRDSVQHFSNLEDLSLAAEIRPKG